MRGIILRAEADQLIVQATAADVQKFARNAPVQVAQIRSMSMSGDVAFAVAQGELPPPRVMAGDKLYNAQGEFIAMIDYIKYSADVLETTTFGSQYQSYASGGVTFELRARGWIPR